MKILIIGGGGREHALADAYSRSVKVKKVFVAPGNDLMVSTSKKIVILSNFSVSDFSKIIDFAKENKIDLVDVAQDEPLANGLVDKIQKEGIKTFGPTQNAAEIEWNKEWARTFMQRYKIPIPIYKSFSNKKEAIDYINSLKEQCFYIKASGLAAGKGAIKTENKKEAIDAIEKMNEFGKAGKTFLIEECLIGEEFSLFAICDGKNYLILRVAQDHKTVFDADKGLNTGGMGCVSPIKMMNKNLLKEIDLKILKPFISGMIKEGRPYKGILYLGGILTKDGVKVIEFNARWGDPEAEVIIPSIKTDYLKIVESVIQQKLNKMKIKFDNKVRVSIAGCSRGYPKDYSMVKGKEICGLNLVKKYSDILIYGAGIQKQNNKYYAMGGRIFHLVASGKDIFEARKKAYHAISSIYVKGNNLHFRNDIGWRDIEKSIN